jgi:hypothetical protein
MFNYKDIIDEKLPILAGKSLGNLELGTHISHLKKWLFESSFQPIVFKKSCLYSQSELILQIESNKTAIPHLVYTYKNGLIDFTVDIFSGKIIEISCGAGYQGLFIDTIGIGTPLELVKNLPFEFHYREGAILSHHKEAQGFYIDMSHLENYYEYDHIDELPADLLVTRMGIFSQYIDDYDVYAHYYDPYIYAD